MTDDRPPTHERPDASRVLVSARVRAFADRAFAVFTEQIGQWWRANDLFVFQPGRSGVLAFDGGQLVERYDDGTRFVIGDVLVWNPPQLLVVEWRQATFPEDVTTELHVRFDAVSDSPPQTRVTVEHFGWDRLPAANVALHGFPLRVLSARFAEWWQQQLAAVDDRCAVDAGATRWE